MTHDLKQAQRVGDFTWLLVDGRLIEARDTGSFFNDPQQEWTRQFLQGEVLGRRAQ
ncbi:hypothetical protein [Ammoniphilus sp. 3BR4]|uniref:hypothetical protein n=1 Tax=Ammoniphilus sp. 3BR4 TaxID=3158265 RepID=UPI003466E691